ncbi:MAG: methyltransferase domain-containing protein [bacterium]|nr:methyltransferase domain-containing protein [bacterium]
MVDYSDRPAGCWCGVSDLEPLRPDYGRCRSCGTVVFTQPWDPVDYADGTGFYGDRYWRRHVPEVLGLPGLEERARADLPERDVYHLARLLDHLEPGGRVLELGCGAGSLTYLLGLAGFASEGLELAPAAIELSRRHFGIVVHEGPIENLPAGASWNAVVAVDVLEHLADPLATLEHCRRRLAEDGKLCLQTPCYRDDGQGWEMLLPREHLYLFTEGSVQELLRRAGFRGVEVTGSLFPHDMWVVASPEAELGRRPEPLAGVTPVAVALIDAYGGLARTLDERDAIDADRRAKERDVEALRSELGTVRADQRAKEHLLGRQHQELRQAREDQGLKGELIDHLSSQLVDLREDQQAKEELIDRLGSELGETRADQLEKAELIERLSTDLESARGDQQAKEELIDRLDVELHQARDHLAEIEADRLYRFVRGVRARFPGRRS